VTESKTEREEKQKAERDTSVEPDSQANADESAAAGTEEGDESASRVAAALGVEDESATASEGVEGESAEPEVQNRATRRRDEAVARRRKKRTGSDATARSSDEPLPKDKNARAKELLARRQEQASGRRPIDLLPGEMVDDALSRMAAKSSRWVRTNFGTLQWVVVAGVVGLGGFMGYAHFAEKSAMAASGSLASAIADERGHVMAEDKRSDEEKEYSSARIFKTEAERQDAAMNGYNQVIDQHSGTGPAILAKLGQAGVFLDKKDFPHALEAYAAVLASPLAAADPDVKGRAIEGAGFAKEGKGDLDGALASFKELEGVDVKPFKELAQYHQARVLVRKDQKDQAKDLLKKAHEKLTAPSTDGRPFQYLEDVVEKALRDLDPTALPPPRPQLGGAMGSKMTPEEIQALVKRAQEAAQKKAAGHAP
jgi:hypothetical protein